MYINGKKYDEPYLDEYKAQMDGEPLTGDFTLEEMTGGKTVPENQLFLMGIIVKIV